MRIKPRAPELLAGRLLCKPLQRRIIARQKIFDRISPSLTTSQSALATLV
jgi:hypothetical protein